MDGSWEGSRVGVLVGAGVGVLVGDDVGDCVGSTVGSGVTTPLNTPTPVIPFRSSISFTKLEVKSGPFMFSVMSSHSFAEVHAISKVTPKVPFSS